MESSPLWLEVENGQDRIRQEGAFLMCLDNLQVRSFARSFIRSVSRDEFLKIFIFFLSLALHTCHDHSIIVLLITTDEEMVIYDYEINLRFNEAWR